MRAILFLVAAVIIVISVDKRDHTQVLAQGIQRESVNLTQKAQLAAEEIIRKNIGSTSQVGEVLLIRDRILIREDEVQAELRADANTRDKLDYIWFLSDSTKKGATATAMGLDRDHHFVNSYLVGVHPFPVDNKWLPLYTLTQRKAYQLDKEQYNAEDLWQNSAQAYVLPRGDCEDHALILADWLISEGVDAKVVIGKYKASGHAWVVARQEGKVYLLEATDKRAGKSWNHYPLAQLSKDYHPEYMFNRTSFWRNNGSKLTKDYMGGHWEKTSRFIQ